MNYRQLFFIEGRLLGEASRGLVHVHETLQAPMSTLHFCGTCGEVFAKCPVIKADGSPFPWQSYRMVCRKCLPANGCVPGSLWLSFDQAYTDAFPLQLLNHELLYHLDHYERTHQS